MSIYEFEEKKPSIGKGTYVFKSADVIGNVIIRRNCYIGPGARIRGDYGFIRIGDNTSIEENVVIHARPDDITNIGSNVTIGHSAVIQNATIKDWAEIGEWSVFEGAIVKNKQKIPNKRIAVGVPAKILSKVSMEYDKQCTRYKKIYTDLSSERFPGSLREN